jgi:hypothetical protein
MRFGENIGGKSTRQKKVKKLLHDDWLLINCLSFAMRKAG